MITIKYKENVLTIPKTVKFLTTDKDGSVQGHECLPQIKEITQSWLSDKSYQIGTISPWQNWKNSLMKVSDLTIVSKKLATPQSKPLKQVGGNHYQKYRIQPIEAIQDWLTDEEYIGYLRGNIIKYQARWRDKGGLEDLNKASWYQKTLIAFIQNQQNSQ